jgi:SAM-dependent methyltransferase
MPEQFSYQGSELPLFEKATAWKEYFSSRIKAFIRGDVLEVGAGMGENIVYLHNSEVTSWTSIEPDEQLFKKLEGKLSSLAIKAKAFCGQTPDLGAEEKFDTIVYIDVLEHIENDSSEIERAYKLLKSGGCIIVLSPAFQSVYSSFDKAIGHYRRYTKGTLEQVKRGLPLKTIKSIYLESVGYLMLWLNRHVVKKEYPSEKNISVWQRFLIPVSKLLDKIIFYSFGKTVIAVWKKSD